MEKIRPHRLPTFTAAFAASFATEASAQQSVSPHDHFSWSENCGFMNWRPATLASDDGPLFLATFMSGLIWCENVGWMNLGDGSPANGSAYANLSGEDSGINIRPDGQLAGFAWAPSIGWVNFSGGSLAQPPNPALIDPASRRLRGYAWA